MDIRPAVAIAPERKPQSNRVADQPRSGRKGSPTSGATIGLRILILSIVLLLLGAFGGFTYRGHIDAVDIQDSTQRVLEFRSENEKLKAQIFELNTKVEHLEAQVRTVHAHMEEMKPSSDSYVIGVNKSMVVAEGNLTIGLIGSPTSENLKINVNGKEHLAAAGDIIEVTPNPSTQCRVSVQSFDMFKAVVVASCGGTRR